VKRKRFQRKRMKDFQKLKRSKIIHCLMAVAFLFLVGSCGGGAPPSSAPVKAKTPSAEKKKVEPVQVAEKVENKEAGKKEEPVYTYNPVGKPDPFKPFIQLTPEKGVKSAHLTPLQKYDISQLKLVAIITSPDGNVALVEDALGKGYFLRVGTVIGKNDGKVKKILKDRVIVEEVYLDILGQTKVNEIPLFLHQLEEGGES
jgi:type IV pilus assembly protein PilP